MDKDQSILDMMRFSDILSKFTGISKTKIDEYLKQNSINSIFEHPASIGNNNTQITKIEDLRELHNLYKFLKIKDDQKYKMDNSTHAGEYFKNYFCGIKDKERFVCGFLNNQNILIELKVMHTGTVNESPVYPREIVKAALLYDSTAIILAHNHPGGSVLPSTPDISVTRKIKEAAETVGIRVIDHVIIGNDKYYSMLEHGELDIGTRNLTSPAFEKTDNYKVKNKPAKTANRGLDMGM